jgi:hypothetical protein
VRRFGPAAVGRHADGLWLVGRLVVIIVSFHLDVGITVSKILRRPQCRRWRSPLCRHCARAVLAVLPQLDGTQQCAATFAVFVATSFLGCGHRAHPGQDRRASHLARGLGNWSPDPAGRLVIAG